MWNDPNRLIMLFHHRWAVPILAELHRAQGAKFVTLCNRLGVSNETASYTLQSLIEKGWVVRNPGHGHPMRPEYLLTRSGVRVGPWCAKAMRAVKALDAEQVVLRKWSLPVTLALRRGRQRFSEMKAFLPGLTARALAAALRELESSGLVQRRVTVGRPPASIYELTSRARRLANLF